MHFELFEVRENSEILDPIKTATPTSKIVLENITKQQQRHNLLLTNVKTNPD
eukprot:UN08651